MLQTIEVYYLYFFNVIDFKATDSMVADLIKALSLLWLKKEKEEEEVDISIPYSFPVKIPRLDQIPIFLVKSKYLV